MQKQLVSYLQIKDNTRAKMYGKYYAEQEGLYNLWGTYGELIIREMMRQINKSGTYSEISIVQSTRNKIVKRLKELEELTNDENGIMVISEGNAFDGDTIDLISKNPDEEISKNEEYESRLNYLSFFFIGVIVLTGYFYIRYFF